MTKKPALPTMESKAHPDITEAAEEYVKVRDARMKLTQKEIDRRDVLRDLMQKHGETVYEDFDAGLRVEIVDGESKVKVKRIEEDEGSSIEE